MGQHRKNEPPDPDETQPYTGEDVEHLQGVLQQEERDWFQPYQEAK